MWISPSLTLHDKSAKLGTRRVSVFMLRNEIIVVLPIQQEDSTKSGNQRNCKERLLAGKKKIIREATGLGVFSYDVTNNVRLLRWCYSNRLIRQIPYFNYFKITVIEKSEHNVYIKMNIFSLILEWFTPRF